MYRWGKILRHNNGAVWLLELGIIVAFVIKSIRVCIDKLIESPEVWKLPIRIEYKRALDEDIQSGENLDWTGVSKDKALTDSLELLLSLY